MSKFDYQKLFKNPKQHATFMNNRITSIVIQNFQDPIEQHLYTLTTTKIYNPLPNQVFQVTRDQQQIMLLKDHINHQYGGYLIPILPQNCFQKSQNQQKVLLITYYLNDLLKHKLIRQDKYLFGFLFIQESQLNKKSSYQRFLNKLINMSREYLNKVLTRQDNIDCEQEDTLLQQYRLQINQQQKIFKNLKSRISIIAQQQAIHKQIAALINKYELSKKVICVNEANQLLVRCEKMSNIFDQICQAFKRRVILRQTIKQLKANAIRYKYNTRYESTQKILYENIKKYGVWTQQLVQQLQCNVIIVGSLIKQLIIMDCELRRKSFSLFQQEN